MTKGLISTLTYMYRFIAMGRGVLNKDELLTVKANADMMSSRAGDVLKMCPDENTDAQAIKTDLAEAALVDQHIDEMVDWLLRQEIV